MRQIFALAALLFATQAHAQVTYFHSSEPGCDGSNPDYILCDDFEDGEWYETNCDTNGGPSYTPNDGWCGGIFSFEAPTAVCSGAGVNGTDCAADSGEHLGGGGSVNIAQHGFANGAEDEVWIRWYYKAASGYQWGAEKNMNPTDTTGGIVFANIQLNCGTGVANPTASVAIQLPYEDVCNGVGYSLSSNKWYFFEMHMKVNTPNTTADGTIQLWIDDCGVDGTSCSGSPTSRYHRTNIAFQRNHPQCSGLCQFGMVWLEGWANPGSTGTAYWDQLIVSTAGPIGFMGAEESPATAVGVSATGARFQ